TAGDRARLHTSAAGADRSRHGQHRLCALWTEDRADPSATHALRWKEQIGPQPCQAREPAVHPIHILQDRPTWVGNQRCNRSLMNVRRSSPTISKIDRISMAIRMMIRAYSMNP